MAKTKTLLDELKASEPFPSRGGKAWDQLLRKSNPKLMAEVDALIDAFNANDQDVRNKRPTKTSLSLWLQPKVSMKHNAIIRYIDERANGVKG